MTRMVDNSLETGDWLPSDHDPSVLEKEEGRKYLMMHSTHFIYGYMTIR